MNKKIKKIAGFMLVICIMCVTGINAHAETNLIVVDREFDSITLEEFDLLARCVMAEAGGEHQSVQYKVCEVILNRVESDEFPDSIEKVIYQENQFEVVKKGMLENNPTESVYTAVTKSLNEREFPSDVLYFNSIGYFDFAVPYCQDGKMWFSSTE